MGKPCHSNHHPHAHCQAMRIQSHSTFHCGERVTVGAARASLRLPVLCVVCCVRRCVFKIFVGASKIWVVSRTPPPPSDPTFRPLPPHPDRPPPEPLPDLENPPPVGPKWSTGQAQTGQFGPMRYWSETVLAKSGAGQNKYGAGPNRSLPPWTPRPGPPKILHPGTLNCPVQIPPRKMKSNQFQETEPLTLIFSCN